MSRRQFLTRVGAGALGAALASPAVKAASERPIEWKMVTTWPKNFPGLGTGAENIARYINEMSNGRLKVKVYGAGELVPAFEVFDTVSKGTAQMGHGAAYYWKGKHAAAQFFASVPFGLTAQEMNAWLFYGGGLELWQELYAPFNLVPLPGGNTGVQMGGWFNREINSLEDLKGLKMRIPGLGGEVLTRAGGTSVNIPGGELFNALKNGTIDATEWVGPYNDLAFGLYKAARFYYYPGWQEPGSTMEAIINKAALVELPSDLQHIVLSACKLANADMLAEFTARNNAALRVLVKEHGVQLRRFPDDVLHALRELSTEVLNEVARNDAFARRVLESLTGFREQVRPWTDLSERAFLIARDGIQAGAG
ncbi:MAG: twin-arginine translocation signal domain-containing protein [Pseudomonadota bacterium]